MALWSVILSAVGLLCMRPVYGQETEPVSAVEERNLAIKYLSGTDLVWSKDFPKDKEKGITLLKRAIAHGDTDALNQVTATGYNFMYGRSTARNGPLALELFEVAASLGNVLALHNMGVMFDQGTGIDPDPERARQFYEQAVEKGNKDAAYNLSTMYLDGRGIPKNIPEGLRVLRTSAERGNGESAMALASSYATGTYGLKDRKQEFLWTERAAALKIPTALTHLGFMYRNGLGVPIDNERAAKLYMEAADLGDTPAAANLSSMYEQGIGVPRNDVEALRYVRLAAGRNHATAQCVMGVRLHYGKGIDPDDEMAARWAGGSASAGDACGEDLFGLFKMRGYGVRQDIAAGIALVRLSADKGYDNAQFNLGTFYLTGEGLTKDASRARGYLQKASAQRFRMADNTIAYLYATGTGVTKSISKALQLWRSVAEDQGAPDEAVAMAAYNLGAAYSDGSFGVQNDADAERWMRIAVERGYSRAIAALGELLVRRAKTTDQSPAEFYSRAAAKGVHDAAINLAIMYLEGKWVARDDAQAAIWFSKAADAGEPVAQTKLGIMYLLGRGVGHDDVEAARWLRKAADQDYVPAMVVLARLYDAERGVEKAPLKALAIRSKVPPAQRVDDGKVLLTLQEPVRVIRLEMSRGMIRMTLKQ